MDKKIISATVAENKRKRGRPTVYQKYFNEYATIIKQSHELARENNSFSIRSKNDDFYICEAFHLLYDFDKNFLIENFFKGNGRKYKNTSILIQIGRAYMQDDFTPKECTELAKQAIADVKNGERVHKIAQRLRTLRLLSKVKECTDRKWE